MFDFIFMSVAVTKAKVRIIFNSELLSYRNMNINLMH